jgi:hypothetical protein
MCHEHDARDTVIHSLEANGTPSTIRWNTEAQVLTWAQLFDDIVYTEAQVLTWALSPSLTLIDFLYPLVEIRQVDKREVHDGPWRVDDWLGYAGLAGDPLSPSDRRTVRIV